MFLGSSEYEMFNVSKNEGNFISNIIYQGTEEKNYYVGDDAPRKKGYRHPQVPL